MSLAHIKTHWVKYYVGVGVAWTAYTMWKAPATRTVMFGIKGTLLWPLDIYQQFAGATDTSHDVAKAAISGV